MTPFPLGFRFLELRHEPLFRFLSRMCGGGSKEFCCSQVMFERYIIELAQPFP